MGLGLAIAPFEVGKYAFEGVASLEHCAAVVDVGEFNLLAAVAVQYQLPVLLRQFFEGLVDVEPVVICQRGQHVKVIDVAPVPATDGAGGQAGFRVGDDPVLIEILGDTQAVAAAAGARGVVEGEQAGFQFINRMPTLGTGVTG